MFSKNFSKVLEAHLKPEKKKSATEQNIKVNIVISKVSFWYEKIRAAVDYREEHLLRKAAIYRHLKRFLFIERRQENMAKYLLRELIRARHLPNDAIPESKIDEVSEVINKYLWLIYKVKKHNFKKIPAKWINNLIEVCAVEIQKNIAPNERDESLRKSMFSFLSNRTELADSDLKEKEKEMQIFVAVNKFLAKADQPTLFFELFVLHYSSWLKNPSSEQLDKIAEEFEQTVREIDAAINHPWQKILSKLCKKMAMVYIILRDVLRANQGKLKKVFSNKKLLVDAINKAITARQKRVRVKLRRAAIRSIIYVFITKMALAIVLEIPIDYYLGLGLNYVAIATNVLFPPLLMFSIAILIKMPPKKNSDKISQEIEDIVYHQDRKIEFTLRDPKKRSWFLTSLYNVVYLLFFFIVLYYIVVGLTYLRFGPLSIVLFIFFLALVSFFGLRIRRPVRDLFVIDKKENVLLLLLDFFFTPFIYLGNWMSEKFSQINVFAMFLDFIIESPFKLIVATTEDLTDFVREKKDDLDRHL